MNIAFSQSCERNKEPILDVLKLYLSEGNLLEVGSGTGQHAVFFAKHFPNIQWVCTDLEENHSGIKSRIESESLTNIHGPKVFKIGRDDFPDKKPYQYVFTANTLHIISWKEVKTLLKLLGKRLREGSLAMFYGPFNFNGEYTTESNKDFDQWLKENHGALSGIRNFENILNVMNNNGFKLLKNHEMPANNHLLVFERLPYKK